MSGQITFETTCEMCLYGKNLGGKDYGCRSERRRQDKLKDDSIKLVNDKDYSCEYAERGFIK